MFFDLPLLDPILSVFIICFIMRTALYNLWRALKFFRKLSPFRVDVYDVHVWSLDGTSHGLSSHIVVAENTSVAQMAAIKKSVRNIVANLGAGEFYTTLEF